MFKVNNKDTRTMPRPANHFFSYRRKPVAQFIGDKLSKNFESARLT